MIDGRFDQQFAELLAGDTGALSQPAPNPAASVWVAGTILLVFLLSLGGLALA